MNQGNHSRAALSVNPIPGEASERTHPGTVVAAQLEAPSQTETAALSERKFPRSCEEQQIADKDGQAAQGTLDQPPADLPERMDLSREAITQLVEEYRAKIKRTIARIEQENEAEGQASPQFLSLEIRLKQMMADSIAGEASSLSLSQLASVFKRFDWRAFNIVPKVRQQNAEHSKACWAFVATETFESSLMKQRAIFGARTSIDAIVHQADPAILNVNSTLDKVFPFHEDTGRHEPAFKRYLEKGIPLSEILFSYFENRDSERLKEPPEEEERIKAIAWDWALEKPWRIPCNDEEIRQIKEALLEHGPLAVMVQSDKAFQHYGKQQNDDAPLPGINLCFPAHAITFEKDDQTGMSFLDLEAERTQPALPTDDLLVKIPASIAPVITPTATPIPVRPTACDDAVIYDYMRETPSDGGIHKHTLAITKNNAVLIEKDAVTGEVNLQFPANTNAQFTSDSVTGDLEMFFPADKAPVFCLGEGESVPHFVLLLGWDSEKEAWIIQNTAGTDWGYQCNGPNLKNDTGLGNGAMTSNDRGFMYIRYGSNAIGQYAAWLEAELLEEDLWQGAKKKLA